MHGVCLGSQLPAVLWTDGTTKALSCTNLPVSGRGGILTPGHKPRSPELSVGVEWKEEGFRDVRGKHVSLQPPRLLPHCLFSGFQGVQGSSLTPRSYSEECLCVYVCVCIQMCTVYTEISETIHWILLIMIISKRRDWMGNDSERWIYAWVSSLVFLIIIIKWLPFSMK